MIARKKMFFAMNAPNVVFMDVDVLECAIAVHSERYPTILSLGGYSD